MHIHIYSLIHYVRHARLLGSSLRYVGMMLFMLLISLLQLASAKPASATLAAEENRRFAIGFSYHDSASNIRGRSGSITDPVPPDALNKNTYTSVFNRLKPRIVMIPRMNRTPKPKSVYRCFTRAPGMGVVVKCEA
jgi:hypothetical protein